MINHYKEWMPVKSEINNKEIIPRVTRKEESGIPVLGKM